MFLRWTGYGLEALNLYKYDVETDKLGEGKIWALPKDFSAVSMTVNKAIIEKRRDEIEALVKDGHYLSFRNR